MSALPPDMARRSDIEAIAQEELPPDATFGLREEMQRLEEAERFAPPDPAGPPPYMDFRNEPGRSRGTPLATNPELPPAVSREPKTLEDLYAYYPVGDGAYRLRIERTFPRLHQGYPCSGFLGDEDNQLSLNDFAEKYGGGRYKVSVLGPTRGRTDANGQPMIRQLAVVDIGVSGAPALGTATRNEDEMRGQLGEPAQVAVERLRMERDERQRHQQVLGQLQQELRTTAVDAARPHEQMIDAIGKTAERTVADIREMANRQLGDLREEIRVLREQISAKETESRQLRDEIVNVRTEAATASRNAETDQIRELKERHRDEITRMSEQHRNEITQQSTRHGEDRRNLESTLQMERERIREDAKRREEQLTGDYQRHVQSMKETHDARISDLQRQTEREIGSVKENRDREIFSIKTAEESKVVLSDRTAQMRVESLQAELSRLHADNSSLRSERDDLRKEMHKDPRTVLKETRELAREFGMIDAAEAKEEGEIDWKKELATNLRTAIEKGPEYLEKLSQMRSRPSPQEQQARMQQMQQMQMRALPHRLPVPAAMRRPGVPPSPGTAPPVPAPYGGPIYGTPPPAIPPLRPAVVMEATVQELGSTPPPATGLVGAVSTSASPIQPQLFGVAAEAAPAPAVEPTAAPAPSGNEQIRISEEAIVQFVAELDGAIRGGTTSPEMFAKGLVDRLTPPVAAQLLQALPADTLVALAQQHAQQHTAIVTRDGQKYIRAVWQAAGQLTQQPAT